MMSDPHPLKVLIVEDNEHDAVLLAYSLEDLERPLETKRVENDRELRQALSQQRWDVILSDYSLPAYDAFKVLTTVKELSPETPIIIVSGTIGEETAVEAMRAGACDYLMKDKLGRLAQAVRRQLVERELRSHNRAALAALRASEESFRLLVEGVQDYAIFMMDTQGVIRSWNSGAERVLGFSEAEAVGEAFDLIFTAEDRKAGIPARELTVALREGRCTDERWHVRKGCGLFWASGVVHPLYDGDGLLSGFAKVMRDSTAERQQHEEKEKLLQLAEQRTRELQKLAATSLAINSALTLEAMLQVGTQQAAAIIGAHQAFASVQQKKVKPLNSVYLSGKYAAHAGSDGAASRIAIDQALSCGNKTQRLTQAQLESRADWQLLRRNGAGEPPVHGWLAAPLIGREGDKLGFIQLTEKREGEFTADDEAVLMQIAQILAVAVENQRLYAKVQEAHRRKEKALEELRQADRRKDEFLAMLSHELRSPLNVIGGHVQLLRLEEPGSEDFFESLDAIERNMRAQTQLVSDLLDVSRIITGKLMMEVQTFALPPVIEQAAESVRFAAEAKGIALQLDIDPKLDVLTGDATRIQQIVWNLLANAVKFTPKDGYVRLIARQEDARVVIIVKDSGLGISPEFLPYVFDRFHQEDSSKTRRYGGLGLGLAIVRHIVELHGGTVAADSAGKDSGAVFTVSLPVKAPAVTEEQGTSAAREAERKSGRLKPKGVQPLSGTTILAVDDQADARELIEKVLSRIGATVVAAGSAQEALQLLQRTPVDLVVSDIGMPELNGYDLMRQWRAIEEAEGRPRLPAAALTAYISEQDQAEVADAGYDTVLFKPVRIAELIEKMIELRGRKVLGNGS